jgi:hypothetical protein
MYKGRRFCRIDMRHGVAKRKLGDAARNIGRNLRASSSAARE